MILIYNIYNICGMKNIFFSDHRLRLILLTTFFQIYLKNYMYIMDRVPPLFESNEMKITE